MIRSEFYVIPDLRRGCCVYGAAGGPYGPLSGG